MCNICIFQCRFCRLSRHCKVNDWLCCYDEWWSNGIGKQMTLSAAETTAIMKTTGDYAFATDVIKHVFTSACTNRQCWQQECYPWQCNEAGDEWDCKTCHCSMQMCCWKCYNSRAASQIQFWDQLLDAIKILWSSVICTQVTSTAVMSLTIQRNFGFYL